MRLLKALGLLAACVFCLSCDNPLLTGVEPSPSPSPSASPTPAPLADVCKIRDPILLTMDVKGAQAQIFFLGQIPIFRAHPIYDGDSQPDFDRNNCPGVWDWTPFDEAALGCRPQGAEGFGTMRYDCHVAGFLTIRACIVDISGANRCGVFFTEAKSQ